MTRDWLVKILAAAIGLLAGATLPASALRPHAPGSCIVTHVRADSVGVFLMLPRETR